MNQIEFEKRRTAAIKALGSFADGRIIKVIDLVELLLELEPDVFVVLPCDFVVSYLLTDSGGVPDIFERFDNDDFLDGQ